jgi:hypothetical protein
MKLKNPVKVLLLSDETMSANAGGLSQTLYNIFSFMDEENILCVTSSRSFKNQKPGDRYINRYITYRFEICNEVKNRLAKYINPFIEWLNFRYNYYFRKFRKIRKQINEFAPDVVISCSNGPVGLYMHHKLLKKISVRNVFPYFMDDWMYQKRAKWLDKEITIWAKKILADNPSWLMISKDLSEILQLRYQVEPVRLLEIHNPVDLANAPEISPVNKKDEYTFAYAGSLWPMHFDAFYLVAKSIKQLQTKRKIKLVVFTSESFWNWRKNELEPLGVIYGEIFLIARFMETC